MICAVSFYDETLYKRLFAEQIFIKFHKVIHMNKQARVAEYLQPCAHCMNGQGFETRTSTNACGYICKYSDLKGSAATLRCRTRGESEDHTGKKSMQGIHSGFKIQGRHHYKSKTGVSVVTRKGLKSFNMKEPWQYLKINQFPLEIQIPLICPSVRVVTVWFRTQSTYQCCILHDRSSTYIDNSNDACKDICMVCLL